MKKNNPDKDLNSSYVRENIEDLFPEYLNELLLEERDRENNREIEKNTLIQKIKIHSLSLLDAPDEFINDIKEFSNDKDFIITLMKVDGMFLCIASEELRGDKDVVLTAVKQNGHSYKYACKELLDDEDILDVYESFAIANQLCIKVRKKK